MFIADSILRGYMESYEDFYQEGGVANVDNIIKEFTLIFEDPDGQATSVSVNITAMHSTSQFGEVPNKVNIYNNEDEIVCGAKDQPVYLYFYDESGSNIILT
jgi:hypothetical protein